MTKLISVINTHRQAILRISLVLSCLLGISFQVMDPPSSLLAGWGVLKAFTIQSNIWIAGWSFFLWQYERAGKSIKPWMLSVKFMFTTSILLTYTVFALLLAPFMELSYLLSPTNIFLHTLTPVLALIDTLLFDHLSTHLPRIKLLAFVMPLVYAVLFVVVYELTNELPVPYFFLNYRLNGWFSVTSTSLGSFYWVLLLMGMLFAFSRWLFPLLVLPLDSLKRKKTIRVMTVLMVVLSLLTLVPHLFY